MSNPTLDTIMSRRSIRAYTSEQITDAQLETLTKVAVYSPTASNRQEFHFTFVQCAETIAEFEKDIVDYIMATGDEAMIERTKSRGNKIFYNAPTLVLLSAKPSAYAEVDAGIAVQTIALAAKSLGLDSVILGMPRLGFAGDKCEYWEKKFAFPPEYKHTIAIAIGHGDMAGVVREPNLAKSTLIK